MLGTLRDDVFDGKAQAGRAIYIHVSDDVFERDGWIVHEIIRPQKSSFLADDEKEKSGASGRTRQAHECARDLKNSAGARAVVGGAVADGVWLSRTADAEVVEMRRVNDVLVRESRFRTGWFRYNVAAFDSGEAVGEMNPYSTRQGKRCWLACFRGCKNLRQ